MDLVLKKWSPDLRVIASPVKRSYKIIPGGAEEARLE